MEYDEITGKSLNANQFNFDDIMSEYDGTQKYDQDEDFNTFMNDLIISTAKKNLCFELEYIQTVIESINIRASVKFDQFRSQIKEGFFGIQNEDSFQSLMFEESKHSSPTSQNHSEIKLVDSNEAKAKEAKQFLKAVYFALIQMKTEYLNKDSPKDRKEVKKALKSIASHLERTRLYLDGYIYPRDLSLNLMDVQIEENHLERKRAAHLTERLYNIVYRDFFTIYAKCSELDQRTQLHEIQDIDQINKKVTNEQRISTVLQGDLERDSMESSFIDTQTIVSENKTTRDLEETRKQFMRNTFGAKRENMLKVIQNFSPSLSSDKNFDLDQILDKNLCLIIQIRSLANVNYELNFKLYQENSYPYSLNGLLDAQVFNTSYTKEFAFINISMRALLSNNMALIINILEKKKSRSSSQTQSLLKTKEEFSTYKVYKGYTIIPLSKMFWNESLKLKQLYYVKEAMFYKPSNSFCIEDKYATLIDKRGFSKYKDPQMAKMLGFGFTYKMQDCLNESCRENKLDENMANNEQVMVVNTINFNEGSLKTRDKDQFRFFKSKEKYRFNDVKIDLDNVLFAKKIQKSPVIRIQVALRDNFGLVYDTIYQSMSDNEFQFCQTYESLIYPQKENITMHESFFIRIPTKSIETLKKLYVIFLVQTLVTNRDSKGSKIKTSNYMNELDKLQFKTEFFGILPLYDHQKECILKNESYIITLYQMDDPLFREFVKQEHIKHFKELQCDHKMRVSIKFISSEFTHNAFINDLMLLHEKSESKKIANVVNKLKEQRNMDELIIFHDKILNKLFQIMSFKKGATVQDQVFETIIQIIQLFQNEYKAYKDFLNAYIEKHFAHPKVYISLLHQVRQTSEIIKQGFQSEEDLQNEEVILSTMKYLYVILKIIRISFREEQQCQDSQPDSTTQQYSKLEELRQLEGNDQLKANSMVDTSPYFQKQLMKFKLMKKMEKSVIEEDDEDEESDDDDTTQGGLAYINDQNKYDRTAAKASLMRKKAIRNTIQHDGLLGKQQLPRREFIQVIQKSLLSIFEGCHKDQMKSTMSIRAILYENITDVFDQIVEFMDEKFLAQIMKFLYDEQPHFYNSTSKLPAMSKRYQRQQSSTPQRINSSNDYALPTSSPRANQMIQSTGTITGQRKIFSRGSELIEDYVSKQNFLESLKDLNFINEEYITKHKIIAMGKVLENGILDKVPGNLNRIVKAFCENIDQYHLKRPELAFHIFFFLHQLFIYLKVPDDFAMAEDSIKQSHSKVKLLQKQSLDLRDFFTKILPDIVAYLRQFYKDSNSQYKLKESKVLEECFTPFKEKAALVMLSVANHTSKEMIRDLIFKEPKKLTNLMILLKKMSKKIKFKQPYHIFFETKMIQVIRKVNHFVISIFMDMDETKVGPEYHQVINQCRVILLSLWSSLARIKQEFKGTTRAKTMVKDQLKVQKNKMLKDFCGFWKKYKEIGQPWKEIRNLSKVFNMFLTYGKEKAIPLYMMIITDTIQLEYKKTQDIFHTSNSIFTVFNELNLKEKSEFCQYFYQTFETEVSNTHLYANEDKFRKLVEQRLDQMQKLSEALQDVNYSNSILKQNLFYRTFCQAKLMEVFWELKLFRLFNENKEKFKKKHAKLRNFSEMAFTDLRFLQIIQQSEEDYLQIGQREIKALIQIDLMKSIVKNLKEADMYEKALEIFNQMKDLFENVFYDFDAVSRILEEQSQIYKDMAQNQNRHYASYFKIGFFGQSFPKMLKNQEFIYRGGKLTKRIDVLDSIKKHFPQAIHINDQHRPNQDVLNGEKQYLQITPVFPLTFRELKDFGLETTSEDKEELALGQKVKDLPDKLKTYYTENFKNMFYKETVIAKRQGDELQSDIQIEIFTVKDKFPTIINMQNITYVNKITFNAVDKATRFVQEHMENIEKLKKTVINQVTKEKSDLDLLASFINATLESPIQGGIERYLTAFINETYLSSPTDRPKVIQLLKKMEQCAQVVYDAIQVYQKESDDDAMYTKMHGDFLKFKEQLAEIRTYIDDSISIHI